MCQTESAVDGSAVCDEIGCPVSCSICLLHLPAIGMCMCLCVRGALPACPCVRVCVCTAGQQRKIGEWTRKWMRLSQFVFGLNKFEQSISMRNGKADSAAE